MRFVAAALLGLAALAACSSEFTFSDSVNSRLYEFKPRAEFGDELSVPYVLGAEFAVFVEDNEQETDFVGWTVDSTDPAVLQFRERPYKLDQHILAVDVTAAGEGTAELLLRDSSGEIRGSAAVEVRRPTRAKLYAAPIYALENPDFRGETPRPQIVVGGTATFAVEYLHDDLRLQGSTNLLVEGSRDVEAAVRRSELADNRNWLQLTVGAEGPHSVQLALGKLPVDRFDVIGVRPAAIAGVELIDADADTPEEVAGEWLVVAQAVGEDKEPIYGVDFEWHLPGFASFDTPGDVFVYEHDTTEEFRRVTARAYGVESAISIRAAAGEPASSNDTSLACAVSDAPPPGWALGLLLLAIRRRRR